MVAALYHGVSVNNIVIAASTGDISKHYATSVLIDGILSAMLLLLIAIWILFLSGDLKRLKRKAWWQSVIIGLTITTFGATLWFRYPTSIHLPAFLLTGLILLLPLLFYGRNFKQ